MRYCVVGLGPAGARAVAAIRARDPQGEVRIFAEEAVPFYFRAALPQYALGRLRREEMWALPESAAPAGVTRVDSPVTGVDPAARRVRTGDGAEYAYDRLLLACGTRAAVPEVPGADLKGVGAFRTLADAEALRAAAEPGARAVILGGGPAALSMAHTARRLDMQVTLLAPEGRVGGAWLDARASQIVYRRLAEDGVDIRLGEGLAGIEGERGRVAAVATSAGRGIACRWVGLGQEGVPCGALLAEAADPRDGALRVNTRLETGFDGVYAAGDVCRVWDAAGEKHVHTPGWLAASLQGQAAGANMAGGTAGFDPAGYHHAGMVYDVPLTVMGRFDAAGDAEVTSAPTAEGYRRLVFHDGRLIGAAVLGDRRHAEVIRRVIELGVDVRGYELQLLRTDVDLNRLLRPVGEYHLY